MLLLTATLSSLADSQRLVVWQKSGQKVYFDLNEEPETTFEDGNLVIRSSRTTVSYPLTNVLRYTYEGGTITDVGDVKMRPGEVRLEVYTLDGVKIKTVKAQGGQRTVVSLADQAAGTYIVKAGEATYKFMKR